MASRFATFQICLSLIIGSTMASLAQTDVTISIINIPGEYEGQEIALAGFLNDWSNSASTAVVENSTLTIQFEAITLTPLDEGWLFKPEGANTAFGFFEPGTWNQKIVGNYGSNDNNFRLALSLDISNEVIIDAQYNIATTPVLIIDQMQAIMVNGEQQVPAGSTANLEINVSNLPAEIEGMELALVGSVTAWNNSSTLAIVSGNALSYTLENVPIQDLGAAWGFAPEGANASFSFVIPGTWTQKIKGNYYGLNDNHFRVKLIADSDNVVEIDATHKLSASPAVVIDQNTGVIVNGEVQIPPPVLADVSISVINLPGDFNGRSITLLGALAETEVDPLVSTVSNNSLSYSLEALELTLLGTEWTNAPLDANATFAFANTQAGTLEIVGDYADNDKHFRIRLAGDMDNSIVIDAANFLDTSPLIIDKEKGIVVNNNLQIPNRTIDPTKFTWPGGKWKALIMSYDDGPAADTQMVNLFNKNSIVGTFNLATVFLDTPDFLESSKIASLFSGHEVANHSVHHPYLAQQTIAGITSEIEECNDVLSGLMDYNIHGMAYPFGGIGTYDYRVMDIAKNQGIRYARTTNDSYSLEIPTDFPDGLMQWSPTVNDWDAENFSDQLLAWDQEKMALAYIWGHSHFLDETGWTRLTTFCETVGNRNDIWYAKNIEVADYLLAISNLIYEDNKVRNPSADIAIWMKTEDGFEILEPTPMSSASSKLPDMSSQQINIYPNPANETTTIQFVLEEDSELDLKLFDLQGRLVRMIADQRMESGNCLVKTNTNNLKNGGYIIKMNTGKSYASKLLIVKHE